MRGGGTIIAIFVEWSVGIVDSELGVCYGKVYV